VIRKQDILDRAGEWGLRPDVVEKDYVLGWLLAGFATHDHASRHWVFKGGTCLKKCFFETYRFSEDLDFSLFSDAAYDEPAVRDLIVEVANRASEMSGIDFSADRVELKVRRDKLGRPTYQGRIAYQGPLVMPNWPRVLLDITQHEAIVGTPARRSVFHPYSDELPAGAQVLCYSMEELFAEKTRALLERTRPRDLYDVVQLWDRRGELSLDTVRSTLEKKCTAKGVATPTTASLTALVRGSDALRADWTNMLAHQLPSLPALDTLLARLGEVLGWIDAPQPVAPPLPPVAIAAGETVFAPRGGYYWGAGARLELVRFAGANRLKVAFTYHGKPRVVEPYSFRRKDTGNLLLYAWEDGATHIKAFNTAEILDVRTTAESFLPRFRVEFTG
jgi:predicted nucleotidyltransferase component of viral defense system